MRNVRLFSSAMLLSIAFSVNAQVPPHPMYIQKFPTYVTDKGETKDQSFDQYFESWKPGTPLTEDDNFFISRVKPKKRFVDTKSQVDPNNTRGQKLLWWTPIGINDKSWGSLPRYIHNADNFSMWPYVDIHGNWSDGWIRVPGGFSDAAHKNGVPNGCILFFDSTVSEGSDVGKIFMKLIQKENGEYKNVHKLIKFMKYYGVDGLGVNPEGSLTSSMVEPIKEFFEECHKVGKEEGWDFKLYWYDAMNNSGYVSYVNGLSPNNSDWFQRANKENPVSDAYMGNYWWGTSNVSTSIKTARDLGRDPKDIYMGFDIQGGWIGPFGVNQGHWKYLENQDISIGLWGAHTTNMVYENSNEFGSDGLTIQTTYQKKLEQVFTGGTRNPANCPPVNDGVNSSGWEAMTKFHGMAKFLEARSSYNELPFITRFCLGNGASFKQEGKVTFNHGWYNMGTQDYLPTWRWWVVDDLGLVPTDAINCEFTFDDAWFAGSAIKLYGATKKSNIRMFKTQFDITDNTEITVRYKVINGTDPHLNFIWSADGQVFKSYKMAATKAAGEWGYTTFNAKDAGMTGKIISLGFSVESTSNNYELLLGELAIDNKKAYNPVKPVITNSKLLSGRYNEVDFKLIFNSPKAGHTDSAEPIYNADVDTWYFEIYTQAEGGEPVLCTTTSSWAAYVVGAPADQANLKSRFGVRAVAPDGKTFSDFAWTDYMERKVVQVEDVVIDKSIIKANEDFTIKFVDPTHKKSYSWQIVNSATGESVISKPNLTTLTTKIAKLGSYDLIIKKSATDKTGTRICGMIQISPDDTGAIPTMENINVAKTALNTNESTTATVTVTRLGEGKVSRGVSVRDPEMLRLPASILPIKDSYSIAFWFKAEKFAHGRFGTNLINKRNIGKKWPHNNWGSFWVHIWPMNAYPGELQVENQISFTLWNQYDDAPVGKRTLFTNDNIHEAPNGNCMTGFKGSDPYGVTENTWNHVVFSVGGGKQNLWFNGKLMKSHTLPNKGDNTNGASGEAPIYIGGTNVYHGGLIGTVDELQVWNKVLNVEEVTDAMQGYNGREIPENLQGYWDFESVVEGEGTDGSEFPNKGKGGDVRARMIKFEGAGGESTLENTEAPVKANNNELGNPAISGTLDVKTSVSWSLPGANAAESDKTATISYASAGDYNVEATLVNRWGKDSKAVQVVVTSLVGINDEALKVLSVYPNPFVDAVNVLFTEGGVYTLDIYTLEGKNIDKKVADVAAGEVIRIGVDGAAGMYIIRVMKGDVCVKSIKVNKQ